MLSNNPVPLAKSSRGVDLEKQPRTIQDAQEVTYVSLNPGWLSQLGLDEQGAATVHALATRPVVVQNPAIIIQRGKVLEDE